MLMTRDKTKRTLVVALILIGLGTCGRASSCATPIPTMPHHPAQGIYLPTITPTASIQQPLLP